jgi:hypothetical protein
MAKDVREIEPEKHGKVRSGLVWFGLVWFGSIKSTGSGHLPQILKIKPWFCN